MIAHFFRVQKTKSQRQWIVKGDDKSDDLIIYPSHYTYYEAKKEYEKTQKERIHRSIMHNRPCLPDMTAVMKLIGNLN